MDTRGIFELHASNEYKDMLIKQTFVTFLKIQMLVFGKYIGK